MSYDPLDALVLAIGLQALYQAAAETFVRQGQILSRRAFIGAHLTAFVQPLDVLDLMRRRRPVGLVTSNAPAPADELRALLDANGRRLRAH